MASFELTALGEGTSNLSFSNVEFYEPFAGIATVIDSSSPMDISATAVPEPQTAVVFGLALVMMLLQIKSSRNMS